jgi:hypothetical protein
MTSPRPIPYLFILWVSWSFPNKLNSLSIPLLDMPTPVSYTLIFRVESSTLTNIETFPLSVNLSAFDCRFKITYWILSLSAKIFGLSRFSKMASSSLSWLCAYSSCNFMTSLTISRMSNILQFYLNFPERI